MVVKSQRSVERARISSEVLESAIDRGVNYLKKTQHSDGSWLGDYGGPMFLLPLYVAVCRAIELELDSDTRAGIVDYIYRYQNDDGGWGLDIVSPSLMFTTVWNYVALRMLGESKEEPRLKRARNWISSHGGAVGSASWGKISLAIFNLYDYRGLHPIPPEFWLMPKSFPLHPGRYWCHNRMVYLPLAYLYGTRSRVPLDPLLRELRDEIYLQPYDSIDWPAQRWVLAETDRIIPHSQPLKLAHRALYALEEKRPRWLRKKALKRILELVRYEDQTTNYICIGPVNKLFNTLVWHFENPRGPEVRKHAEKLPLYLWRAEDGIKMNGYNSSQLWDTAFAVQAISESGRFEQAREVMERAFSYIESNQVLEDPPQYWRYFRDPAKGGWPFSNRPHGWPISDCTAEGLKASLLLEQNFSLKLPRERLRWAVDLLLFFQNSDGGWATYERRRAPKWLELFNPSDVFANIMVDYSYVECTSACIQALSKFRQFDREYRKGEIERAIERGKEFILSIQRDDGGWLGSWGICFTYGTWFGIWGLRSAGLPPTHPAIQKGCEFLLSHQNSDGGWGEHPRSCLEERYISEESQPVRTSWALLALLAGGFVEHPAVAKGIEFLLKKQRDDGSWPQEMIAGIFNKTCAIHYDNYPKIFPLWALSYYRNLLYEK